MIWGETYSVTVATSGMGVFKLAKLHCMHALNLNISKTDGIT